MKTNKPFDQYLGYLNLLEKAQQLSVHQLGAYHSVQLLFKVVTTHQPKYLADIFTLRRPDDDENVFPHRLLL